MEKEDSRTPLEGATRASLLLVGSGHTALPVQDSSVPRVLVCASGAAALRLAADPSHAPFIEAVFADAQLVDMSGTGLLDRIAGVLPGASRVLLVSDEDGDEGASAPPSALVTDVWARPPASAALRERFVREQRALERMHALQAQLGELHGALDVLRARYLEARRARDLLVDSVGVGDGGGSCWWHDYRQLTALRETGCAIHRRTVAAASLEGELLRVGVDLIPGALGREFSVQADPALLREILERLCAGMRRHGRRGTRARAHCRTEPEAISLELSAPLARHCDAAALLDPLAALDGGPVEGAPLDLPLAEALSEAHGSSLRLSVMGGELRARLRLPRGGRETRRADRARPQVVRALDRTL